MDNLESWFHKYNGWSFSKHRMWNSCKLEYFYRYIGTATRFSKDFDINKLKLLKELKNKYAIQGISIHNVLENQISNHISGNNVEYVAKMDYINNIEYYRLNAINNIVEYYNGMHLNQRYFDIIRSEGYDKLEIFYGIFWSEVKKYDYLRHEKFDKFLLNNVPCLIKADYITKYDDQIFIYDWKTGEENEDNENELQIGVYFLWALNYYHVKDPKNINCIIAYLTSGIAHSHKFDDFYQSKIKSLIINEFNDMNQSYCVKDYEPNPEPSRCLSCQFSTICPYSLKNEKLEEYQ